MGSLCRIKLGLDIICYVKQLKFFFKRTFCSTISQYLYTVHLLNNVYIY